MYKVSVECNYGGETVKMSTYGAASSSLDNATTADIDPQSTATAAYVKKALVQAVVKTLSSTTATGTCAEKREKTLSDVNSLVNNLQTTVSNSMSDGAMEYPDDPTIVTTLEAAVATSITSIVDSTTGASFETAMNDVIDTTQSDDWYVPPTMDSELAGAAAEGAAKLICAPWATTPDSTSDQEAQIKECAKIMADGSIKYKNSEGSIHKIAAGIMGTESYNGWTYWHYNLDGAIVPIDHLRQRLISRNK